MPRRWTKEEEFIKYSELYNLYIIQNKSIGEISREINFAQSTIYDRLIRLKIKPNRSIKKGFNNSRHDICIPTNYSKSLSEFFGIMLGDGHISATQVTVTLGTKEFSYVQYVAKLISFIFKVEPKICTRKSGYNIVYFGSTRVVRWLLNQGFVHNKVQGQVGVPEWIFSKPEFVNGFLRGFFDTDGSVYKLKFGVQLAFTNRSLPLLKGISRSLRLNGYFPSKISLFRVYLTRRSDIARFFKEIDPANLKHKERFTKIMN